MFHNNYFITCANFPLSEKWNPKQEMFIHTNRNFEWENAKTNGPKQNILAQDSGRTDELFSVYSEKTEAALAFLA